MASANRKKHILVGTHHLEQVGGSELYTLDLLAELQERDSIAVEFFAVRHGALSVYAHNSLGVPFMSRSRYDLVIASHDITVEALRGRGPAVQICHGTIPSLEQPFLYADYHIGISQEVCDHLHALGYANRLLLNGLNLKQKKPASPVNTELKTVLSLCQSEEANLLITKVCDRLGIKLIHHNKHKNPTFNIENEINKADMVVGIGRSVYDAMACGRPCIIFDHRDYNGNKGDGYLHPHFFDEYVQTNCSGRYRNIQYDADMLAAEFKKYRAEDGAALRHIATERLDVQKMADELLNIEQYINAATKFAKWKRVSKHRLQRLKRSIRKRLPGTKKAQQ